MIRNGCMRIIKLLLISIVVFGALLFLMSLLFPSEIRVSRAINIGAKKESVYRKIHDLRQWQQWNDAASAEGSIPDVVTDSSFESQRLKINLEYSSVDSIRTAWKNKDQITYGTFRLIQITPDSTVVQWYFDVGAKFPWDKFSTLVLDNQLGPPMENALVKLKNLIEKNR